jgi:predicted dehydrogenase
MYRCTAARPDALAAILLFLSRIVSLTMNRRSLLHHSAVLSAGALLQSTARLRAADAANDRVRVAVVGLGRGMGHVASLLKTQNTEIAYLCEIDESRLSKAMAMVQDQSGKAPQAATDFRKILEDKNVDALSFALPNHWHAPATILACAAGKHVYVEKPGSHNVREAELMVEAARKHDRRVQMGNQRRSYPLVREAMQRLQEGVIGKLTFARSHYNNKRTAIGQGDQKPAAHVDLDLWQGPAPLRDDVAKYVHYDWHWLWHWGGGELANNGPHGLDIVRWGLGADYPLKVTCNGGRYHYDDAQETPDTISAAYDFGSSGALWDGSSCQPRPQDKSPFVSFYGTGGSMVIGSRDEYTIYDLKGAEVESKKENASDVQHFQNFIDSIRNGTALNSEIEEGQKSTLLCHLGNIAWRTQSTVLFDPETKQIAGENAPAKALWSRSYREGWEPKV